MFQTEPSNESTQWFYFLILIFIRKLRLQNVMYLRLLPIVLHFILYFRYFYFFYVRFLCVLSFVWCFSAFLHFIEQHHIINGTRHLQIDIQFVSKRFSIIFIFFGMIYVGPCVIHRRLTNHHHYSRVCISLFRPFNPFVNLCFC